MQTIAIAFQKWGLSPEEIAAEYDLSESQVNEAIAFCAANQLEIAEEIAAEEALELTYNVQPSVTFRC